MAATIASAPKAQGMAPTFYASGRRHRPPMAERPGSTVGVPRTAERYGPNAAGLVTIMGSGSGRVWQSHGLFANVYDDIGSTESLRAPYIGADVGVARMTLG